VKLIEFDGVDFKIADQALYVSPIREMFRADKSRKKETFWKQISYLWFMCDPRSSYMYIIDEKLRAEEVKKQEGFGDTWKPSQTLLEAMDIYKRQSITTQSLLIDDMRYGLDCIRAMIRQIGTSIQPTKTEGDDENTEKKAMKLDKALDSMTKAVDKIPDLAKKLADAEKALVKDFATEDKARGNTEKAVGEDV
jgi:hypothetical protein